MISAGFCHLLGDAIVALTQSFTYPLAPFLCACGFMSTLIADQIVEAASGHHPPEVPVLVSLSEKEGEEEETVHSVAFVGAVGATPFPPEEPPSRRQHQHGNLSHASSLSSISGTECSIPYCL